MHVVNIFFIAYCWQCHYSYNACGLGSDGTDGLVNLVQEMQHRKTPQYGSPSLFGAKITGGGSGGSVCVIGKNCLKSTEEIAEASSYARLPIIVKELSQMNPFFYDKTSLNPRGYTRAVSLSLVVCVLLWKGDRLIVACLGRFQIQQRYKAATGYLPIVFDGSSPGAGKFGYLKIRRRPSSAITK